MNLKDIQHKNEQLQKAASQIANLVPQANLLPLSTLIMRSCKRLQTVFPNLINAQTEMKFCSHLDKMEDETDEIVYALDRLSEFNTRHNIKPLTEFIKFGYELLSIYSMACDRLIELRTKEELF